MSRLRWPQDRRINDVQGMLQSVRPVIVKVEQRLDMSDHDFVEEQERCLQVLSPWSCTLEVLFELTLLPSKALNFASLLPEIPRYKDTIGCRVSPAHDLTFEIGGKKL